MAPVEKGDRGERGMFWAFTKIAGKWNYFSDYSNHFVPHTNGAHLILCQGHVLYLQYFSYATQ